MGDSTALTTTNGHHQLIAAAPEFDRLGDLIAPEDENAVGMVAASSARVYRATYESWRAWCAATDHDPLTVNFNTVGEFLQSRRGTKSSKQRELSALRTLAEMLRFADPLNRPVLNNCATRGHSI